MTPTITCDCCGKTVPLNPRLKKKQEYCSARECQQMRRSARKAERYKSDTVYRKKQHESQEKWRKRRPSHEYQRTYRETHPEYVDRNRVLQRERNKRRPRGPSPMIVNGTSLSTRPNKDEVYAIFKVKSEKIVNRTSFIAKMKILSKEEMILVPNGV